MQTGGHPTTGHDFCGQPAAHGKSPVIVHPARISGGSSPISADLSGIHFPQQYIDLGLMADGRRDNQFLTLAPNLLRLPRVGQSKPDCPTLGNLRTTHECMQKSLALSQLIFCHCRKSSHKIKYKTKRTTCFALRTHDCGKLVSFRCIRSTMESA